MADDTDEMTAGRPSKSALKREFVQVQGLVRRLSALSDSQLAALPLDDDARDAVKDLRRMKKQAMERQVRYAAGLVARLDHAAIAAAVDALERPQRSAVRAFHDVEVWRARLIEGERGLLEELAESLPGFDRARAAELIEAAQREAAAGRPARAARALFRYLAELRSKGYN